MAIGTVIPQVPTTTQDCQYQGTGKLVGDKLQQYSADLVCWELGAQWSVEVSLLSSQRRPQFPRTRESLVCWWESGITVSASQNWQKYHNFILDNFDRKKPSRQIHYNKKYSMEKKNWKCPMLKKYRMISCWIH